MSIELEVGELKGKFSGMETRMKHIEEKVDALDSKVDLILEKVSEVKGGWKVMAFVASVGGVFGSGITKFLGRLLS